jgi:hypothetical protein
MPRQWDFLLLATLTAAATTPALGQDAAPAASAASTATQSAASVPDFSRLWSNTLGPGFSPPASGPGPVLNKARQRAVVDYLRQAPQRRERSHCQRRRAAGLATTLLQFCSPGRRTS